MRSVPQLPASIALALQPGQKLHSRDRIVMNGAFVKGLGTQPVIVAREIVFGIEDTELAATNVVFVADTMKLQGNGTFHVKALPPGREPSINGTNGPSVEMYCRKFEGARIRSQATDGGKGATGAQGPDGFSQCTSLPGDPGDPPIIDCDLPEPDPTGLRGGRGGNGGNGGAIVLRFEEKSSEGNFESLPGKEGEGGDGGPGGKVFRVLNGNAGDTGNFGQQGPDGIKGNAGIPIAPQRLPLAQGSYLNAATALLGPFAAVKWAQHRLKQAEYLFRSFRPHGSKAGNLTLALQELFAVLALVPENAAELPPPDAARPFDPLPKDLRRVAQRMQSFILNNQNVYGAPRDLYVIPDYVGEEEKIENFEPLAPALEQSVVRDLLELLEKKTVADLLQAQIDQLSDAVDGHMALEITRTQSASKSAADAAGRLRGRYEALKQRLNALKLPVQVEEQSGNGMQLPDFGQLFASAVAVTFASIALPGAAGAIAGFAVPMFTHMLVNAPVNKDMQGLIQNSLNLGSAISDKLQNLEQTAKGLTHYAEDFNKWRCPRTC